MTVATFCLTALSFSLRSTLPPPTTGSWSGKKTCRISALGRQHSLHAFLYFEYTLHTTRFPHQTRNCGEVTALHKTYYILEANLSKSICLEIKGLSFHKLAAQATKLLATQQRLPQGNNTTLNLFLVEKDNILLLNILKNKYFKNMLISKT